MRSVTKAISDEDGDETGDFRESSWGQLLGGYGGGMAW